MPDHPGIVCRYCGARWQGFKVLWRRPPRPDDHDPGMRAAKTNCCDRWVGGDKEAGYAYKKGEYAMVSEDEYRWARHYSHA